MKIGQAIKQLRIKAGLKQAELGAYADTDGANISRIESDKQGCTIETLGGIANGLSMPLSELIRSAEIIESGGDLTESVALMTEINNMLLSNPTSSELKRIISVLTAIAPTKSKTTKKAGKLTSFD